MEDTCGLKQKKIHDDNSLYSYCHFEEVSMTSKVLKKNGKVMPVFFLSISSENIDDIRLVCPHLCFSFIGLNLIYCNKSNDLVQAFLIFVNLFLSIAQCP